MPLVRRNGTLQETSWGEALNLVAAKFKEATPETFGALGLGKTSNEESYLLQKFARVVQNIFLTEIDKPAHAVLPAATWVETGRRTN